MLLHYKSPFNQRLRKKYGYFADYLGFMIPDTVMVDNARGPTKEGKTPYHICTYGEYDPPHHTELRVNTHKWNDAFSKFDEDRDGLINFDEVIDVMKQERPLCRFAELQDMFEKADTNKDGKINLEEFEFLAAAALK